MNKRTTILTLLAIPFLMGNSPMPYPHHVDYTDLGYQIELLSKSDVTNSYRLTVKNKGELHLYGYSNSYSSQGNYFDLCSENDTTIVGAQMKQTDSLFESQTLGPNQTDTYYFECNNNVNIAKVAYIKGYSFNEIDTEVTYSVPIVRRLENETGFVYKIDTDIRNLNDYYYAVVVDVKYEGKDYSLIVEKKNPKFQSYKELDLSKFTITGVTFYRSSYHTYKGGSPINNGMIWMYIFVVGGIFLMFVLPILILVIAGIRKAIKKRKMKREL